MEPTIAEPVARVDVMVEVVGDKSSKLKRYSIMIGFIAVVWIVLR